MLRDEKYWDFLANCTAEEAFQYGIDHLDENQRSLPNAPLFQAAALRELDELKSAYGQGNKLSLLDAIFKCSMSSIPLPYWVEKAYILSYRKILHYKVKSLDDAFGKPFKKGAQINAKAKKRNCWPLVYHAMRQAKQEGRAIDDGLFDEIGRSLGLSRTLVKEYYAYSKLIFAPHLPKNKT